MIGSSKITGRFSQYSNTPILRYSNGVTLIELLIALVISAILIAGIYRAFIHQQKTYATQEQVADMQQNVRVAINRMMREIRMAGFGGVDAGVKDVLNLPGGEGVNGPIKRITTYPSSTNKIDNDNSITIVGGFKQVRRDTGEPITVDSASGNTVTLNYTPNEDEFNTPAKRFISIGGVESHKFEINGKDLTLDNPLRRSHLKGTPIFKVQAITYQVRKEIKDGKDTFNLKRDENTGGGLQPLADNIENIQFEYFDDANPPKQLVPPIAGVDLEKIRMIRVTVTARTSMKDSDYKGGPDYVEGEGSYRKRQISSNIQIRNMGVNP